MTASDFINLFIAIVSFFGVIAAWRAAISSKESAKVAADSTTEMRKQTYIMEKELKYNRSAYLLPEDQEFSIPFQPIFYETIDGSSNELNKFYGDLKIYLSNVGRGNAFHIESYFSISNFDELRKVESFGKPLHINKTLTEGYSLKFVLNEVLKTMKIHLSDPKRRPRPIEYGVTKSSTLQSVLNSNEKFPVLMPSYFQIVLLDTVHRYHDHLLDFSSLPIPKFNLNVKFKEEDSITEDFYLEFNYEAYIKLLDTTDTHMNFSLHFKRVPLKDNPLINTDSYY